MITIILSCVYVQIGKIDRIHVPAKLTCLSVTVAATNICLICFVTRA